MPVKKTVKKVTKKKVAKRPTVKRKAVRKTKKTATKKAEEPVAEEVVAEPELQRPHDELPPYIPHMYGPGYPIEDLLHIRKLVVDFLTLFTNKTDQTCWREYQSKITDKPHEGYGGLDTHSIRSCGGNYSLAKRMREILGELEAMTIHEDIVKDFVRPSVLDILNPDSMYSSRKEADKVKAAVCRRGLERYRREFWAHVKREAGIVPPSLYQPEM